MDSNLMKECDERRRTYLGVLLLGSHIIILVLLRERCQCHGYVIIV